MAKSKEKNKALDLRQQGKSIKEIAKKLKVSKSSVSLWCRDIELTPEQIQRLEERIKVGSYKGRLKGARIQYKRRLDRIKELKQKGFTRLRKLSNRDLLILGAALYWGEGSRKNRSIKIANSDPEIIKLMLEWFKKIWKIEDDRFIFRVAINMIHKGRLKEVEDYWLKIIKMPKEQFRRTTLIKAKNKKEYKNFPVHYGTLTVSIRKPFELYHQIIGIIEGMGKQNKKVK